MLQMVESEFVGVAGCFDLCRLCMFSFCVCRCDVCLFDILLLSLSLSSRPVLSVFFAARGGESLQAAIQRGVG
jgi:hypothetical protein